MAEVKKRAAVRARKAQEQSSKGARRRGRAAQSGLRKDNFAYGSRTVRRTSSQGLSITVQIPPLRRPKQRSDTEGKSASVLLRRRLLRPLLVLPALVFVGAYVVLGGQSQDAPPSPAMAAAAEKTAPDYQPLVPSAEKASTTRYDSKRDLVSYTTNFSGARITVSQQSLPGGFKRDPAFLMKAADSIYAKERIDTARGPLYVAYNEVGGNQTAVFAEKDVLLFIHADRKIDTTSWKSFIELLTAKSWSELI